MNDKRTRKQLVDEINKLYDNYEFWTRFLPIACAIVAVTAFVITVFCN